ncbi:hypothetical protein M405DRAFT_842748 [Rhizopogon salebrosus TDB-379]|nr:hypothetical protein M405DRAFT_842748 [Rhizopogon salebrosus TDB-379]
MTGAADGIVRLYRNYDPTLEQGPLQMVDMHMNTNVWAEYLVHKGLIQERQVAQAALVLSSAGMRGVEGRESITATGAGDCGLVGFMTGNSGTSPRSPSSDSSRALRVMMNNERLLSLIARLITGLLDSIVDPRQYYEGSGRLSGSHCGSAGGIPSMRDAQLSVSGWFDHQTARSFHSGDERIGSTHPEHHVPGRLRPSLAHLESMG